MQAAGEQRCRLLSQRIALRCGRRIVGGRRRGKRAIPQSLPGRQLRQTALGRILGQLLQIPLRFLHAACLNTDRHQGGQRVLRLGLAGKPPRRILGRALDRPDQRFRVRCRAVAVESDQRGEGDGPGAAAFVGIGKVPRQEARQDGRFVIVLNVVMQRRQIETDEVQILQRRFCVRQQACLFEHGERFLVRVLELRAGFLQPSLRLAPLLRIADLTDAVA